jgi:hypothetical protein
VAKPIFGCGAAALLGHQLEPLELGEGRQQPRPRQETLQQRQAERVPNHRGGRDHLARLGIEPVEPSLQGSLDGGWHGQVTDEDEATVLAPERAPLEQVTHSLADEERIAPCAFGEQQRELFW